MNARLLPKYCMKINENMKAFDLAASAGLMQNSGAKRKEKVGVLWILNHPEVAQ